MTLGRPVLCSNVTSLPEVGGDAALYFDPRRPDEIVSAIRRLEAEPELVAAMIEKGRFRADVIGGPRDMARRYAAIFEEAVAQPLSQSFAVRGVDADGWAENRIFAGFGPGAHRQWLEIELALPANPANPANPASPASLANPAASVSPGVGYEALVNGKPVKTGRLSPGKDDRLALELAPYGGYAEILLDSDPAPGFSGGRAKRGCLVKRLVLTDGQAGYDLLPGEGNRS